MKEEHLIKPPQGHISTVPVTEGNEREESLPCQPTLRSDAMESARYIIRSILSIVQPMKNMLIEWTWALQGGVQSTEGILRLLRHAASTQIQMSPFRQQKSVVSPSSLTEKKVVNSMASHDELIPREK